MDFWLLWLFVQQVPTGMSQVLVDSYTQGWVYALGDHGQPCSESVHLC